jgi:hypothetical protein
MKDDVFPRLMNCFAIDFSPRREGDKLLPCDWRRGYHQPVVVCGANKLTRLWYSDSFTSTLAEMRIFRPYLYCGSKYKRVLN